MQTEPLVHPWFEIAGASPYRFITVLSFPSKGLAEVNPSAYQAAMQEVWQAAKSLKVTSGFCNVCGMNLEHSFVLCNADGRNFIVGCDCILRSGDEKMTAVAKLEQKRIDRANREARKRLEIERDWSAQRARNGGKTDGELRYEAEQAEIARKATEAAKNAAVNKWLIDVISTRSQAGNFVDSMIRDLKVNPLTQRHFSPRALDILCDIYCKEFTPKQREMARCRFWESVGE